MCITVQLSHTLVMCKLRPHRQGSPASQGASAPRFPLQDFSAPWGLCSPHPRAAGCLDWPPLPLGSCSGLDRAIHIPTGGLFLGCILQCFRLIPSDNLKDECFGAVTAACLDDSSWSAVQPLWLHLCSRIPGFFLLLVSFIFAVVSFPYLKEYSEVPKRLLV